MICPIKDPSRNSSCVPFQDVFIVWHSPERTLLWKASEESTKECWLLIQSRSKRPTSPFSDLFLFFFYKKGTNNENGKPVNYSLIFPFDFLTSVIYIFILRRRFFSWGLFDTSLQISLSKAQAPAVRTALADVCSNMRVRISYYFLCILSVDFIKTAFVRLIH